MDRVLEQRPSPGATDIGTPVRSVHPLDREVLVVAQERSQRSPVIARRDGVGERLEDGRVAEHQTDLMRNTRQEPAHLFALGQGRCERLLAQDGAPSVHRRTHGVRMRRRPRADPDDVDGLDQLFDAVAGRGVVRLGQPGGSGAVGVVRGRHPRVDETGLDESPQGERVDRRDEPASGEADPERHDGFSGVSAGRAGIEPCGDHCSTSP